MPKNTDLYLRNVIFGISDSLVSTVGLLSGIDVSGTSRQVVILTGVVYAFVEAFSMAVGSFLSEESTEEYDAKGEVSDRKPLAGSSVMFISFILASFIPIVPYLFIGMEMALWVSILLSVLALFIVGIVSARLGRVPTLKHASLTALLGGSAIVIGIVVGKVVKAA
jgi:VIT1/CCC1 family predicted Fe2+/Mn2+ transporter